LISYYYALIIHTFSLEKVKLRSIQIPQDITPPERVQRDPTCDREVAVYGYLRGCNMKRGMRVHLAGVGDYTVWLLGLASGFIFGVRSTLGSGFAHQSLGKWPV